MGIITPKMRWISLLVGVAAGAFTTLMLYLAHIERPWAWGMIAGAVIAFITCGIMALRLVVQAKRFAEAKERVGSDILLTVPVKIGEGRRMLKGYLFLTPHVMHIYLWMQRPFLEAHFHRLEMKAQTTSVFPDVMRVLPEGDEEGFVLLTPDLTELVSTMITHQYTLEEVDQMTFMGEDAQKEEQER